MKNHKFSKTALISALALTIGTPLTSSVMLFSNQLQTSNNVYADQTPAPLNQFDQKVWAQKTLDELNRLRAQNGLKPLASDPALMTFTQGRADTIYKNQKLDHTGNYGEVNKDLKGAAGENLAQSIFTGGSNTDSKDVIAQLYDDDGVPTFGHRKNMLAPFYNKVGIGITYDPAKRQLWVAMTLYQDPSIKSDHDDAASINEYFKYCDQKGVDDAKWPSKYDMAGKEYFSAKYNEKGISQDGIADSKFGPNTKTPKNPTGTESGAPDDQKPSDPSKVDTSKLTSAINDAKKSIADPKQFTDDSVAAVNKAITAGDAVVKNSSATQDQVDSAVKSIQDAVAKLVKSTSKPTKVDTSKLSSAINDAKKSIADPSQFTADSVAAVNKAVADGDAVAKNASATQDQVDAAVKSIQDAVAKLVKASKPTPAPEKPTNIWTVTGVNTVGYIKYVPGYGIAVYDGPAGRATKTRLKHASSWKISAKATNAKGEVYYQVGKFQWINGTYVSFTPISAITPVKGTVTIKYPKGYGINLWKTPSVKGGFYKGRKLMSGTKWKVNGKQNGFYQVGKNQWIEAAHTTFSAK
ncbi:CAP domain-containing protein [Xylocopilactobacillus apis]|uniref:SCP domain-containing protein n=1 Tax=Xylocopilactobacillus apis TaxID=2932183 RepID=A0AAU9D271_9LACO|nr:CAP domain-containing protein [Xylocopilactobacillus apis]BDR56576.1 hypothetical protein KIMC2_11380 [Xylocopilactobacillus apis]